MNKGRILIIDDSELVREQMGKALRQAGYDVLETSDGLLGAFTIHEQRDLRLVICDIHMPRMTGLEMIELVRGQFPQLPIVVLTSESRPDRWAQAKRAGVKAWVFKPCRPEALVDIVDKALQKGSPGPGPAHEPEASLPPSTGRRGPTPPHRPRQ